MREDLSQRFFQFQRENALMAKSERVLVAFSGGKDSVCLLALLLEHQEALGVSLGACHIHHGIRGEEADRDLEFCRQFCKERGVPFFEEHADIPAYCRDRKIGIEEGAREERYRLLFQVAKREGYQKIAVAHTASDQAETVLFRLTRGAGLAGAAGMRADRGDGVIRPLFPFSSHEILRFLERKQLPFTEDSSNFDILYSRNRIRNRVLPELEEINPGAAEALVRFSIINSWQNALCHWLCDRMEEKHGLRFSDGRAPISLLSSLAKDQAGYPLLYCAVSRIAEKGKISIDFERFFALLSLLKKPGEGKIIEIANGFVFRVREGFLCLETNEQMPECIEYFVKLKTGENSLFSQTLTLSAKSRGKVENVNKKLLIIHLASDKIKGELFARNIHSGDKVKMYGMTKSVKKLLQEAGIPSHMRCHLPLVCDEEGILWIPFCGLCDRVRESDSNEFVTLSLSGLIPKEIQSFIQRSN